MREAIVIKRWTLRVLCVCALGLLLLPASAQAAFPGRNGKIAYADEFGEIFTTNPDVSGATAIPNTKGGFSPAWSADGRRLAFMGIRDGGGDQEIYVINADGTGHAQLTNNTEFDGYPAWSPDGTKLVFQTYRDGDYEIYTMNADGTNPTRITNRSGFDGEPDWSPDGTRIAFVRSSAIFPYELFTMNPDGTDVTRVPTEILHPDCGDQKFDGSPDWSPDGTQLVFSRYDCTSIGWTSINTINTDGSGQQTVVEEEGGYVFLPAWSPDGSKIAFDSDLQSIHVVNADGTGRRIVRTGTGADWQPLIGSPPDCTGVAATPKALQPPNGKLRLVTLSGASDPDGDPVTLEISGVTQDEPLVHADAERRTRSDQIMLRAQRDRNDDGRVYRVNFTVSDGVERCFGGAVVEVRQKKKQPAVDSAPPSYDSFGP